VSVVRRNKSVPCHFDNQFWFRNRSPFMARAIHCTLVEVSAMTEPFGNASHHGFRDLVPWADPYIAALIEKLRHASDEEDEAERLEAVDELPPPLSGDPDDTPWQADWSPRNWPRR
jgi:hypothetical protein